MNEEMIEEIQEMVDDFNSELEDAMQKDAAAKRARKLSTELAAKMKEFRAASVAYHNRLKEERQAAKEAKESKKDNKKGKAAEKKADKKADKKGTKKKNK